MTYSAQVYFRKQLMCVCNYRSYESFMSQLTTGHPSLFGNIPENITSKIDFRKPTISSGSSDLDDAFYMDFTYKYNYGVYVQCEETVYEEDGSRAGDAGIYDYAKFILKERHEPALHKPNNSGEENSEEHLLVKIVELIWNDKRENISNKQIQDNFGMGYNRANRFLQLLEDAEIASAQRKGTKLSRIVNLNKAEDFLRGHGCLGDNEEGGSLQIQDGAGKEEE